MCEMKDEWDRMRRVLLLNPDYAHARDSLGDVYHDQLDGALSEYLRLDPFALGRSFNWRSRTRSWSVSRGDRLVESSDRQAARLSSHAS
jgi:hypothetical protein